MAIVSFPPAMAHVQSADLRRAYWDGEAVLAISVWIHVLCDVDVDVLADPLTHTSRRRVLQRQCQWARGSSQNPHIAAQKKERGICLKRLGPRSEIISQLGVCSELDKNPIGLFLSTFCGVCVKGMGVCACVSPHLLQLQREQLFLVAAILARNQRAAECGRVSPAGFSWVPWWRFLTPCRSPDGLGWGESKSSDTTFTRGISRSHVPWRMSKEP